MEKSIYKNNRKLFKRAKTAIKARYLHTFSPLKNFASFKILAYHGIGNQLFQYAAVRAYSIKYDLPIILPDPNLHRLGNFNIKCKFVSQDDIDVVNKNIFNESGFSFNQKFFDYRMRKYFIGYFQTEKYFLKYKNLIREEFTIKDRHINDYCYNYIKKIKNKIPGKQLISIHNRRGDNVPAETDYVDNKKGIFLVDKQLYHPLLSMNYIKKAMLYFPNSVFLVFSNNEEDIKWCEKNILGSNVYFSKGHKDIIDFTLMRMCDHNIIANSTFSWWAAWLNENPKKIVIAPKIWFGEKFSHVDLKDLIPESWIII